MPRLLNKFSEEDAAKLKLLKQLETAHAEIERLREVIREAHQHWVDGDEYGCFQILNSAENTRYEKTARETYS